jgi:hypothetical protein
LAFLWAGIAWLDTGRLLLADIAVGAGSLGMAAKGTTAWAYLFPFVLYGSRSAVPGIGDWFQDVSSGLGCSSDAPRRGAGVDASR